jgi:CubicO group peptidase (beta-lactamase class C family)
MKQSLLVVLIAITALAQAQKSKPVTDRFAGLDAELQKLLTTWHAAGFAVAVVEKDKVVYAKGFGYSNYENKIPVTPNTLFAIGSCTKAFTSSLVGLLEADKKIEYDKPIRTYFPQLKFFNTDMNNLITVRDIMTHRTGLPRHDLSWYLFTTKSRDSIIDRIQYMQPTYGIREKWQYNNFMFTVQGVLAEKMWNKSWETVVKEKLFDSLDFKRSNFSVQDMAKASDAALGYRVIKDSIIKKANYYDINAMGPAGSINSSVTEMANWVTAWINGGKYKGRQVLPAAYIKEAASAQMIASAGFPDTEKPDIHLNAYGFGWSIGSYRGHYRVNHGGNIDGFSANTAFFPTDSIGIIVLANQDGSSIPSMVRNIIADRLLSLKYIDWSADMKRAADKSKAAAKQSEATASSNQKKNTTTSHPLADYEGIYSNKGYGTFEVEFKNDSLFFISPTQRWWLSHYHYDVFEPFEANGTEPIDTAEKSQMRLSFVLNEAGDIAYATMPLEAGLEPEKFIKTAKPKAVKNDDLKKYVGDYDLAGTTVKVYIQNEKTLFVLVPGQPDYELVPLGKDKFGLKVASGYFVQFDVNDKQATTALTFQQPNGNFKAKKK